MFIYYLTQFLTLNLTLNKKKSKTCTLKKLGRSSENKGKNSQKPKSL